MSQSLRNLKKQRKKLQIKIINLRILIREMDYLNKQPMNYMMVWNELRKSIWQYIRNKFFADHPDESSSVACETDAYDSDVSVDMDYEDFSSSDDETTTEEDNTGVNEGGLTTNRVEDYDEDGWLGFMLSNNV